MDNNETNQTSLNNSDASRLMRELNAHLNQSNDSSMDGFTGLQNSSDSDIKMSGDGSRQQTLTQLMKTMYNSAPRQQIVLQGNDKTNSFSVYGQEVDIFTSAINTSQVSAGSNKVKITPVVNFDWDPKYYIGHLVAVHRDNTYMAYVIKGKTGGNIRIINRKTADRWLIKCVEGRVVDVAFAHSDAVILAAVDEIGNLYVHEMQEIDGKTINTLLLNVQRPENTAPSEYHRVIWCPYIPDDSEDTLTDTSNLDSSRVLVLTHDERAEIWSIDMINRDYGVGPINPHDVENGMISIDSHDKPIIDAAFSPDGTALASASLDGEVKFFQVYLFEGTSPRCLHQWKPHDGKPVSCLFFLDDHKSFSPDAQLWKFAVTGANKNQELKVWSCESWRCLQTVRFLNPPNVPSNFTQDLCLKATMDLSARYLALSDTNKKVLYILQLHEDTSSNSAHISSISEFILAQPCLSLAILDASKKRFKRSANDTHFDEITTGDLVDDNDDEDQAMVPETTGVQIRLFSVHTKSLQELLIRYKPECSVPQSSSPSVSSLSIDETGLRDTLSDISFQVTNDDEDDREIDEEIEDVEIEEVKDEEEEEEDDGDDEDQDDRGGEGGNTYRLPVHDVHKK
ncbi:enhancer of mRNA-decapping protein 4-like [Patella vulgata]|uniref:enhancer of mRNA-decapping protein 4-like n=1 Tax=Patella vulgata TaxID=6465 RepID=UPI0024A980F3|nr:enhancer of mRNA-decapping protein 4-like [Patella vulgata]